MNEKHTRSIVKGTTWRIIGTLDTLFLSWLFTGSIGDASKIAGTEVITKVGLYYLHERAWMRAHWMRKLKLLPDGTQKWVDHHSRSLIKGVSWRIFGTMDTIMIALFWTGEIDKALKIGFAEVFTKILLYYLHERLWLRLKWGITPLAVTEVPADAQLELK
ncbi:MAG: DUF2061 domain-containing protein [Bacteroidetes bacterium]|nr:DUF2061 domain-containing protein [Bacteroidota bacterium]